MSFFNVFTKKVRKSKFNLTFDNKLTCDMGYLIPFMSLDVVPGDKFTGKCDIFCRLAPQLAPVMHDVQIYTWFFFVPNRLLWNDWESFITGGEDGNNSSIRPYVVFKNGVAVGSIADFLNVPPSETPYDYGVNALPFRAYNLIYNEWFRDQDLQEKLVVSKESGEDTTDFVLKRACWEKDYFTSSRPFTQKGSPAVLRLGKEAEIVPTGSLRFTAPNGMSGDLSTGGGVTGLPNNVFANGISQVGPLIYQSGLKTDLSTASTVTANDIRNTFTIQQFMETNARCGSRYSEFIRSHFGANPKDSRLQRPELIGSGRSPIIFSEVLQTSSTDNTSPQGNMSGHAISAQSGHVYNKYFEEHGWVIGLMCIRPKTAYQQGIPRSMLRETRYDYLIPEFSNLGERPIKNKEIYVKSSDPDGTFGFAPQYEEYRFVNNSVHGNFRTNMSYWHMGRIFENEPVLNEEFVECNPTKRISAVTNEDNCYVQIVNYLTAVRPLPKISVPSGLK
uniref:Major capsid protein n=1 Tax=Dulem virus 77 TaxID=3145788 RepID=A0AAU8AX51_9VIRU